MREQAIAVLDRGHASNIRTAWICATPSLRRTRKQDTSAPRCSELNRCLKQRPDDPAALNAYGYTLADHNRKLARARTLIERAYAAAPRNAAILDSLGWVLYRQGHDDQALPYSTAAYAEDRGADIGAHYGEVLWQLGRRAEAGSGVGRGGDARLR